jgi:2,3-bisphosphoglycerate-dependent phosphoglycerate mutase
MTTLLIARHGNTFGPNDVVTRVGGRTDLPLVESGLQQGLRLGTHLKTNNLVPDAVFTSHLARAIQTAEKAQESMGTKISPEKLAVFNEIDYGPDENKPEAEVVARLGEEALKAWDEHGTVPDGWKVDPQAIIQAWLDFGQRVAKDYAGKRVLIVSSNGIIRFAPHLTGDFAGFRAQHKIKVSTGALCQFDLEGGKWICKNWNVKPA